MIPGLFLLIFGLLGQFLFGLFVVLLIDRLQNRQNDTASASAGAKVDLIVAGISESRPNSSTPQRTTSESCSSNEAAVVTRKPVAELLGMGIVTGIGVTAWILFLWSFCGGSTGLLPSGLVSIIGYLTGGPILVKRLRIEWSQSRAKSLTPKGLAMNWPYARRAGS